MPVKTEKVHILGLKNITHNLFSKLAVLFLRDSPRIREFRCSAKAVKDRLLREAIICARSERIGARDTQITSWLVIKVHIMPEDHSLRPSVLSVIRR